MAERLPLDPARLRADVARLWPAVAACTGVAPGTSPGLTGAYLLTATPYYGEAVPLALEHLGRALEDAGYDVYRRDSDIWVRGRAAVFIDIADAPPWHPAVEARTVRLRTERVARDPHQGPDVKRQGALDRAAAERLAGSRR